LVERRQITGSGGWQCEDRHAIRVLAQHLLPKLSGAFVLPAASASIPLERRLRRVGQRGGYMSDLASSLVRSPKSKERCVNAILSAESNIEDAGLAHYRDSGLVQQMLCDVVSLATRAIADTTSHWVTPHPCRILAPVGKALNAGGGLGPSVGRIRKLRSRFCSSRALAPIVRPAHRSFPLQGPRPATAGHGHILAFGHGRGARQS
jgi:hypothetical protein